MAHPYAHYSNPYDPHVQAGPTATQPHPSFPTSSTQPNPTFYPYPYYYPQPLQHHVPEFPQYQTTLTVTSTPLRNVPHSAPAVPAVEQSPTPSSRKRAAAAATNAPAAKKCRAVAPKKAPVKPPTRQTAPTTSTTAAPSIPTVPGVGPSYTSSQTTATSGTASDGAARSHFESLLSRNAKKAPSVAASDVWYFTRALKRRERPANWIPPTAENPEPTYRTKPTTEYVGCRLCRSVASYTLRSHSLT